MTIDFCPDLRGLVAGRGAGPGTIDFSAMLEVMPTAVMTCDLKTFLIDYANPRSIALLETIRDVIPIDPQDIVGTSIDIFHRMPLHQRWLLSEEGGLPHQARIRVGREWLDLHIQALPDATGRSSRALLVWSVVTAEVQKAEEQYRLQRMIDVMPVAVMTVDPHTFEITYLNEASQQTLKVIEDLLPVKADALLGQSIDVFHRHPEHQRRLLANPGHLPHHARIRLGPEVLKLEVSAITGTGGEYIGPMLTWSVITAQVAAEAHIHRLAHFDTLTGLSNRATFRSRLHEMLDDGGATLALLFIDLDGFKFVNDNYGHPHGDALLQAVAARLNQCCGDDHALIVRLGGDEFAVVVPDMREEGAADLARDIVQSLSRPFEKVMGVTLRIGASVGIALSPDHGTDQRTLQSRADMALYSAKAAGKNTFRTFSPELEYRVSERVRLENKLGQALEDGEGFHLYYQPIWDIETRQVKSREALLRFFHPSRGWIPPGEFIPIAEESGLIRELGEWVIEHACRDAATWPDGVGVAVNVSACQLGGRQLPERIASALAESGLSPDRLEVEITESALLLDEPDILDDLVRIRDMGVRVALDDFGTGYSSLAHLSTFPFDKIKIDGSFVRGGTSRADCAAIVGLVAALGKRLGVPTVAEGVETQEQLDFVRAEGCTQAQGYFLGEPRPM